MKTHPRVLFLHESLACTRRAFEHPALDVLCADSTETFGHRRLGYSLQIYIMRVLDQTLGPLGGCGMP
jgi:hypothetical protein